MNDSLVNIQMNPVAPVWLIVVIAFLLGSFLIWTEFQRKSKLAVPRMIGQVTVILAMLGLSLRPSYLEEDATNSILLLSKTYSKTTADSLLSLEPGLKVYRTDDAIDFPNAEVVPSYQSLAENSSSLKYVLGEGLPVYAFDLSSNYNFRYFPCKMPSGVTEITFEHFLVNRRNTLKGKLNNRAKASMLQLDGPGGIEDSLKPSKPGEFLFSLSFVPKQAGIFMYSLALKDSAGITQSQQLPIEVFPERKLNVLFLQGSPSYEIRYLKNFLSDHGHGVVIRNQVSKNAFQYEFGNHASLRIDRLSPGLLKEFDLLCIHADDMERLSSSELKSLEDAVNAGLGIIIQFDQVPSGKSWNPFLEGVFNPTSTDTVHLDFPSVRNQTLQTIPASITIEDLQSVTETRARRKLSGFRYKGFGKAGFQLLRETYSLVLRGQPDAYSEIWTPLITKTARSMNSTFQLRLNSPFPRYINDPIFFEVISSGDKPSVIADMLPVSLVEDVVVDDLWHGKIWVGSAGWHQLVIPKDSTVLNFYVSNHEEWSSLATSRQMHINQLRQIDPGSMIPEKKLVMQPISIWIFFGLFLLASGFLWLEPRI